MLQYKRFHVYHFVVQLSLQTAFHTASVRHRYLHHFEEFPSPIEKKPIGPEYNVAALRLFDVLIFFGWGIPGFLHRFAVRLCHAKEGEKNGP
jgi:hypothetical protein